MGEFAQTDKNSHRNYGILGHSAWKTDGGQNVAPAGAVPCSTGHGWPAHQIGCVSFFRPCGKRDAAPESSAALGWRGLQTSPTGGNREKTRRGTPKGRLRRPKVHDRLSLARLLVSSVRRLNRGGRGAVVLQKRRLRLSCPRNIPSHSLTDNLALLLHISFINLR